MYVLPLVTVCQPTRTKGTLLSVSMFYLSPICRCCSTAVCVPGWLCQGVSGLYAQPHCCLYLQKGEQQPHPSWQRPQVPRQGSSSWAEGILGWSNCSRQTYSTSLSTSHDRGPVTAFEKFSVCL